MCYYWYHRARVWASTVVPHQSTSEYKDGVEQFSSAGIVRTWTEGPNKCQHLFPWRSPKLTPNSANRPILLLPTRSLLHFGSWGGAVNDVWSLLVSGYYMLEYHRDWLPLFCHGTRNTFISMAVSPTSSKANSLSFWKFGYCEVCFTIGLLAPVLSCTHPVARPPSELRCSWFW